MKLTKESLNRLYDKLTLSQIEVGIKTDGKDLIALDKRMIGKLWYIKYTFKWRDDPRYKKVSFGSYLDDKFKIREATFDEKLRIYAKYGEDALDLGVGLISKIKKKCGVLKTPTVIKEIKLKAKRLKNPITRLQVEEVINEFKKPEKIKPHKVDWRYRYEMKNKEHVEALEVMAELAEQNSRLKKRVKELEAIEKMISAHFVKSPGNVYTDYTDQPPS